MVHRFTSLLIALALTLLLAASATASGPTATATKVTAQAAKAAKSCKKATARAAKATTPAQTKKLKKAKKKACKKAKTLAAKARAATATVTTTKSASGAPRAVKMPDAPGSGFEVGIDANTKVYSDPGAQMDKIDDTHVGWLREELEWSRVEGTEGQLNWATYDRVYSDAAEHGMRILATITSPPTWAEPSWNWIPEDPARYASFVAKVAERYGPGGTFWASHPELPALGSTHFELWNEPYVDFFAANGMDAGRYANLVIAGADAGRAANPATKYLASTDDQAGNGEDWTRAMFAARPDLADHVDAFAVHPYGPDLTSYNQGPSGSFRRNLEETGTALVENGAGDKPMWITEIGWSTCGSGAQCVSEQRQAELVRELGQLLRTTYSDSVRGLFMFNYTDWDSADPNSEHHYGFVHENGTPKPAVSELRSIADSQS